MAPHITMVDRCEQCYKHSFKIRHPSGVRCDQCLPGNQTLRSCKACRLVLYCSKECQTTHWADHKRFCLINVGIKRRRDELGVDVAERQSTFERWCQKQSRFISNGALSALEIMKDKERTESHVFLVYVDVIDRNATRAVGEQRFIRSIREARCATRAEVNHLYGSRFNGGSLALEQSLAPRYGLIRILVVDDGLPIPLDLYTLPTDLGDDPKKFPYDVNWFTKMKAADDWNPDKPHGAQPETEWWRSLIAEGPAVKAAQARSARNAQARGL